MLPNSRRHREQHYCPEAFREREFFPKVHWRDHKRNYFYSFNKTHTSGKARLWTAPSRCNRIQLLSQKALAHTQVVKWVKKLSFCHSLDQMVKLSRWERLLRLSWDYRSFIKCQVFIKCPRKTVVQDRTMQNWQQEPVSAQSRFLHKAHLIINNNLTEIYLGEYFCWSML